MKEFCCYIDFKKKKKNEERNERQILIGICAPVESGQDNKFLPQKTF